MKNRICMAVTGAVAMTMGTTAWAVDIDNDIPEGTVGHWLVDVDSGGDYNVGELTARRADTNEVVTEDLIYEYLGYIDTGINGSATQLSGDDAVITGEDTARSTGSFTGANGNTINWTAVTSIPNNEAETTTTLTFTAETGSLGDLRYIQYLDEDVFGASDDFLFTRGSAATNDLQLFTVDSEALIGVSQSGAFSEGQGLVNASFAGWAADQFSDLRGVIQDPGVLNVSPTGVVDTSDLPPSSLSGIGAGWGLNDVTTALAWNVDANASTATIITSLGGVPDVREIPGGEEPIIPTPSAAASGLVLLAGLTLRRQRRA